MHSSDSEAKAPLPAFEAHREALVRLAEQRLHPLLRRRLSPEDVVQETFASALKKRAYLEHHPEVPLGFKLRTLLLQVLADAERKHLQSQKRDVFRELEPLPLADASEAGQPWEELAASMTSPLSFVAREERYALLRHALEALSADDRAVLLLRHFEHLGNTACAERLGIAPKAASIRYVRALQRLRQHLEAFTEFRP